MAALFLLSQLAAADSHAATALWTGGGGTSNWFTASNWDINAVPTAADLAATDGTTAIGQTGAVSNETYVGAFGTGVLTLSGGGTLANVNGFLGFLNGTTGTVNIDGATSSWTNSNGIIVGVEGTGFLNLTNGGQLSNVSGTLGNAATAQGTAQVDGANSRWISSGSILVGNGGTGNLTLSNGGSVSDEHGYIGNAAGSSGTVSVSGANSSWSNQTNLFVGNEGVGSLTISGGGSVTDQTGVIGNLSNGANSVSVTGAGSSWINSVALSIGNDGTGSLTIANGGSVSNGNSYVGNNAGSTGTVTATGNGSVWTNTGHLHLGNYGTGTLTVSDGATVETSGVLVIANVAGSTGTLNIGAAEGAAAEAPGTVNASNVFLGDGAGQITFNHTSSNYVFDESIEGAGTLLAKAGTTFLTGSLTSFTGSFEADGGTFTFSPSGSASVTLGNVFTGSGTLSFSGNQTTLTGNSAAFTGTTNIGVDGVLSVNGSLGGTLNVLSGGTLKGAGTTGTVSAQSGSTVAPGNSIDTLNVVGDVSFAAGSTYQVEIDSNGNSDRIEATGAAALTGGDVQLIPFDSGAYLPGTTYTILDATGGVSGSFASITTSNLSLFLTATLTYDANHVYATLRQGRSFASVAQTTNQASVARAADTLGAGDELYDALMAQTSEEIAAQALQALTGEIHPNIQAATLEELFSLSSLFSNRLSSRSTTSGKTNFWAQGVGGAARRSGKERSASFFAENKGTIVGADHTFDDDGAVGAALVFNESSYEQTAGNVAEGRSRLYGLSLYGSQALGPLSLRGSASYALRTTDTTRNVSFPGFSNIFRASYTAQSVGSFGETAYHFDPSEDINLEAFGRLSLAYLSTPSFQETEGVGGLAAKSEQAFLGRSTLGLRAEQKLPFLETSGRENFAVFRQSLAWQRTLGDRLLKTSFHFEDSTSSFLAESTETPLDALLLNIGFNFVFSNKLSLGLSYTGSFEPDGQSRQVYGGVTYLF